MNLELRGKRAPIAELSDGTGAAVAGLIAAGGVSIIGHRCQQASADIAKHNFLDESGHATVVLDELNTLEAGKGVAQDPPRAASRLILSRQLSC
jgi:hypothetical protein